VRNLIAVSATAALVRAAPADAQGGLNLSWDDCGAFGSFQKNFSCDTNSGVNTLYGSARTDVAIPQLNGHASVLSLKTDQVSLSNWWQLGSGGCRFANPPILSASFSFVSQTQCSDPWGGAAVGGINYSVGYYGPNSARIRTVCAIAGTHAITGTDEYYFFKISFTNDRTVGEGACGGCPDGVCIAFQSILLTQPADVGDYTITNWLDREFVIWRNGAGSSGCSTPVRPTTWGAVKSLYR
jgi:hypothetical protein